MNLFKEMEANLIRIYSKIKNKKIPFDNIIQYKSQVQSYANDVIVNGKFPSLTSLEAVIMMALDQYTYGDEPLITDREYDILHAMWMERGMPQVIYPDTFESEWKIAKHKASWMVGSVRKCYTIENMIQYIEDLCHEVGKPIHQIAWIISPKFDGISSVLEIRNHRLVQALTRGTKIEGQDITAVVSRCANLPEILNKYDTGFLKVELCVPQMFFGDLENQGYKNRRSATSAIVNSPKNLEWANHIDAIPLLWYSDKGEIEYSPKDSIAILSAQGPSELVHTMLNLLVKIRDNQYEYRVDGVILFPMVVKRETPDMMQYSMAFKVNTAENVTTIKRAYISVGRMGMANPMIEVVPCDVNETVVRNVSIGSFKIFDQLKLHEAEAVIIYSAGDVIPQMKLPENREYPKGSPIIHLDMICPICGSPIVDSMCSNPFCPRIITGRIANFLEKTGVCENISDGTIENLYDARRLRSIPDIFKLTVDAIADLPGYSAVSATNIITEIRKLKETPIYASNFIGALGIPLVSVKTMKNVFREIDYKKFLTETNPEKIRNMLLSVDGIGMIKAKSITVFLQNEHWIIDALMKEMNIIPDPKTVGTVVFTGFRDARWEEKFASLGLQPADNVTASTFICIAASSSTGNAKKALAKGIPIYLVSNIEEAFEETKERIERMKSN